MRNGQPLHVHGFKCDNLPTDGATGHTEMLTIYNYKNIFLCPDCIFFNLMCERIECDVLEQTSKVW